MPYVSNEGAQLYWTEQGTGPPLLLIMGLSFTHEMWFRILPAVRGYRALLFDNRGMGRSSVPRGPYSIAQMARDARAVLDAANVQSAHVIGASMGGMIAQELALLYPERVRSLMLACTTSRGLLGKWPEFRYGGKWHTRSREERERSLRPLLYADTTPLDFIEEDLRVRCGCAWCYKGFLNQFAGILMWSSYRRLPRITAPTLVVHGDQDRLVPPKNGRILASRIRGSEFHLVHNAGHILITDQPQECTRLISRFLAQRATVGTLQRGA